MDTGSFGKAAPAHSHDTSAGSTYADTNTGMPMRKVGESQSYVKHLSQEKTAKDLESRGSDQVINVPQTERLISAIGGGMLTLYGLTRGTLKGIVLALIGGSLIHRGVTGHCEVYEALGVNEGGVEDAPTRILAKDALHFDPYAGSIEYKGKHLTGQSIVTFRIDDVIFFLDMGLAQQFGGEQFLQEELEGVVQGIVNSVRWSVLRLAREQLNKGILKQPITRIATSDLFGSRLMSRKEIVGRIEDTSGLTEEMSDHALGVLENVIKAAADEGAIIEIEYIGKIQASQTGGYIIDLGNELQFEPELEASESTEDASEGSTGTDSSKASTATPGMAAGAGA